MWGKIMIPMCKLRLHGLYDYRAYIDLTVRCPQKAIKLTHSLTRLPLMLMGIIVCLALLGLGLLGVS